jgi:dGTPase
MKSDTPSFYEERFHQNDEDRPGDIRNSFQRDRGRIVHSAAFRRLQGKTQVMGVGEGDFHRTRLTHSIECAQIGVGLLNFLQHDNSKIPDDLAEWMPDRDLIEAACFAHDLGHPPFGHGGEKALHKLMRSCGGFEGNGQTLRILSRLEKYKSKGQGINPTRRLVLAVLKYPIRYGTFDSSSYHDSPPKCFYDEESQIVDWALEELPEEARKIFQSCNEEGKAKHRTFDCSLMELADDIAYGVHDIEDIVARDLAIKEDVSTAICKAFTDVGGKICHHEKFITSSDIICGLYGDSYERKQTISSLVNMFVTNISIDKVDGFENPLFAYRAALPSEHCGVLSGLKDVSFDLVVKQARIQQLERRGQRVVTRLFEALAEDPRELIPQGAWDDTDPTACLMRRVCDYVAGMTDGYAEKVYSRLFVPGYGSSSDEL